MGHFFGLTHVYFAANGVCEHATRDILNPLFNATSAGDMILDTHATGGYSISNFTNCEYTVITSDCQGTNILPTTLPNGYFISGPPYFNFLSAEDVYISCPPEFTPSQGRRMREAIVGYWANFYNSLMNTVESLYYPFEVTPFAGNTVISIEDLGNGYANVCRNLKVSHRFQKGFDYVFPDNFSPDPLTAGVDEIPDVRNQNFNFNVIINQVDSSISHNLLLDTRGRICEVEKFSSGSDTKTDFLGSYNFTVEEWDSIQVSDPNLYDYLESNKYHLIKKETEKGVIYEVTIYKN